MLLTTERMDNKRQRLWWAIEAYLTRWRIEETIRLVLAASYFAAVYLGVRAKLEILVTHVLKAAKRIFGIPDFRYYAIADGIRELLNRYNKRMVQPFKPLINENQLPLFDP